MPRLTIFDSGRFKYVYSLDVERAGRITDDKQTEQSNERFPWYASISREREGDVSVNPVRRLRSFIVERNNCSYTSKDSQFELLMPWNRKSYF